MKSKGTKNLTYTQRLQLEAYLQAGLHKKVIAEKLGVCLATVYNELKRGAYIHKQYIYTDWIGDKHYKQVKAYSPNMSEDKYRLNQSAHGAPLKLGNDYEFVRYVEKRILQDKLSPCAVLGEIKRNNLFRTNISKTTMYRYIETGIFMNVSLKDLPFGQRKKQYRKTVVKRPPKGRSIEKRPDNIARREEFGHWEMDCVVGKQGTRETLLTLTERFTRYEIVYKMPNRKADTVVRYLNKLEKRFGKQFRNAFKSITVDNGVEFSNFTGLERSIYGGKRTSIFYCHPYTSCERGSNERLNREIRRLIPKSIDLGTITNKDIKAVERWVNDYPREIFGYATSAEKFNEQIAII